MLIELQVGIVVKVPLAPAERGAKAGHPISTFVVRGRETGRQVADRRERGTQTKKKLTAGSTHRSGFDRSALPLPSDDSVQRFQTRWREVEWAIVVSGAGEG